MFHADVDVVAPLDDLQPNPVLADVLIRARPDREPCVVGFLTVTFLDQFVFIPADDPGSAYLFSNDKRSSPDWNILSVSDITCSRAG